MIAHRITRTTILALVVVTSAALIARMLLQRHLVSIGYEAAFAADLAYLIVPLILVALLFPIWPPEKPYVLAQFKRTDISWRIAFSAIAIGILMRLAWWSQLIAGVSFGVYRAPESTPVIPLSLSFQCPPLPVIGLGFVVMALLVPIIEEVVHRGYIQGMLRHRGFIISVLVSAIVFTVLHRYSSWPFAFFAGIVFGTQYWFSRSLWPSLISHTTVNGLIQIDWRCMTGQWNPGSGDVPIVAPGVVAICALVACIMTLALLIRGMAIRARNAPQ